jgi:hypothetical protein
MHQDLEVLVYLFSGYNTLMMKTKLFKNAFILLVIVGFLNFMAVKFYLYWSIWWMDMVVHFLAGVCVGLAILLFFQEDYYVQNKLKAILFVILGAFFIGILWEIYELIFGITSLSDGIHYVTDTVSDLIMDIVGGFFGSLYGFRLLKKQNQHNNI